MPLAVYIAAPYAARALVQGYAAELRSLGVGVTASWIAENVEIGPGTLGAAPAIDDATVADHALQDFEDIAAADALVLITESVAGVPGTTGGRHVETGYALAIEKPVIVVGEPENVFHRLGADEYVYLVPDWRTAVDFIRHPGKWSA